MAVPTHYFKIILLEKGSDLEIKSYVMPNSEEAEFKDEKPDLRKYYVSVDAIERAAGLIFFSNLFQHRANIFCSFYIFFFIFPHVSAT